MWATAASGGGVVSGVVGEGGGQLPVGVDLGEQLLGLALGGCDGVGAGDPARGRLPGGDQADEGGCELDRVPALLAETA